MKLKIYKKLGVATYRKQLQARILIYGSPWVSAVVGTNMLCSTKSHSHIRADIYHSGRQSSEDSFQNFHNLYIKLKR